VRLRPGEEDLLGRDGEPLLELRCESLGADQEVDLEEAFQIPGLEVARSGEELFAVARAGSPPGEQGLRVAVQIADRCSLAPSHGVFRE
jgi:hypothetical protein